MHEWGVMMQVLDRDSSGYIVAWYPVLVCTHCWDTKLGDLVVLTDAEREQAGVGVGWVA